MFTVIKQRLHLYWSAILFTLTGQIKGHDTTLSNVCFHKSFIGLFLCDNGIKQFQMSF